MSRSEKRGMRAKNPRRGGGSAGGSKKRRRSGGAVRGAKNPRRGGGAADGAKSSRAGRVSVEERIRELSWGYRPAILILSANRLRLFDALSGRPMTPAGIAHRLGLDERALTIVLDALVSLGLVIKRGGTYRCGAAVKDLLVSGGSRFQGNILDHRFNVLERWMHLPFVLEEGGPAEFARPKRSPAQWRHFILGMEDIARESIAPFLRAFDLGGRRRLLDLGGGPGTYTIALCRRYRRLEAVLFDLPDTIPIARTQIREAGLEDRIKTVTGDYLADDIGRGFDAVLLSNIVHSLSLTEFLALARKVHLALDDGGIIAVREFRLDESRTSPPASALFAVNMLVSTDGGNCYTASEIEKTIRRAGFTGLSTIAVTPLANLYIGTKAGKHGRSRT
jgi:predicted O-methyltransferase YrrM